MPWVWSLFTCLSASQNLPLRVANSKLGEGYLVWLEETWYNDNKNNQSWISKLVFATGFGSSSRKYFNVGQYYDVINRPESRYFYQIFYTRCMTNLLQFNRVIVGDTLLTYDIILWREVSDSIQNLSWRVKIRVSQRKSLCYMKYVLYPSKQVHEYEIRPVKIKSQ